MVTAEVVEERARAEPVEPLLAVDNLQTYFFGESGVVKAVDGVSYRINAGESLGIVGESGSGKSVSALSLMRLIESPPGRIVGGSVRFDGEDLLAMSASEMRGVRGNSISMIFQEPLTSLNPVFTIGDQIMEPLMLHQGLSRSEARLRAAEMMQRVGVPSPVERLKAFPHQLSGGMRQRVMIAMALCCNPKLLIADEPTTALDVSIQAQILELMHNLQRELNTSMIFITHDLAVVNEMCDNVLVMYSGRVVEHGTTSQIFASPKHPYTWGLFDCLPRIEEPKGIRLTPIFGQPPNLAFLPSGCTFHPRCPYAFERCTLEEPPLFERDGQTVRCWLYDDGADGTRSRITEQRADATVREVREEQVILDVADLTKYFPIVKGIFRRHVGDVQAVDGVSFTLHKGETLGIVGESGCGKSTLGRVLLRLLDPSSGHVHFQGQDLATLSGRQLQVMRRKMQIIFQDPFSSLNPRRTVGSIVGQPLRVHKLAQGREINEKVADILQRVGLNPGHASRYPHQFSGGQRQRIGIARAIAAGPEFIVADEPVSALDVSIQAQIVNLLQDLQQELGLSYIFLAHDLSVVRSVSDRVAVMYLGKIVEIGSNQAIYEDTLHPYSKALLSAVPTTDTARSQGKRIILSGDVPSPINPPSGCRFHTRCPYAFDLCSQVEPPLLDAGGEHYVACHLYSADPVGVVAPDAVGRDAGRGMRDA
ncbi:MAG TPA: ABC transporter ATP-binding protein [Thermomicrobiales bacterium]|nr:ABC transporter ATP-binding protein [Thermomicrobiales bacterium]